MEKVIKVKEMFPGLDSLTTRWAGLDIRREMEKIWEKDPDAIVVIDFEDIELIAQGTGDEIVGVLIRRNGLDFVRNKVKVINANGFIRGTLNWVASYSKKMVQNNSSS
jgi:hypothetical protein